VLQKNGYSEQILIKQIFLIRNMKMSSIENEFDIVAIFSISYEPQLIIAKSMMDQAGIKYYLTNENYRNLEPLLISPTPVSIELRVDKQKVSEALQILEAIDSN
jgi:hypothetical protein